MVQDSWLAHSVTEDYAKPGVRQHFPRPRPICDVSEKALLEYEVLYVLKGILIIKKVA
jgi:hypothetical protein